VVFSEQQPIQLIQVASNSFAYYKTLLLPKHPPKVKTHTTTERLFLSYQSVDNSNFTWNPKMSEQSPSKNGIEVSRIVSNKYHVTWMDTAFHNGRHVPCVDMPVRAVEERSCDCFCWKHEWMRRWCTDRNERKKNTSTRRTRKTRHTCVQHINTVNRVTQRDTNRTKTV
jgi:hypothetical protein